MASVANRLGNRNAVRVAQLRAYRVHDRDSPQPALEELLRRAQDVGRFPIAWLGFFDGEREWLRARAGVALDHLDRAHSFAFARGDGAQTIVVEDAERSDWRSHPLVTGAAGARFIAVVPLITPKAMVIGSLAVLDRVTRTLAPHELTALSNLASIAIARLEAECERDFALDPRRVTSGGSLRAAGEGPGEDERPAPSADEDLEGERQLSQALMECLGGFAFLANLDGTFVRWSSGLLTATGYTDAEIGAMSLLDMISPRDRKRAESSWRQTLDEGREILIEVQIVDRSGRLQPFTFTGKPLNLGQRVFLLGLDRDRSSPARAERDMTGAKSRLNLALTGSSPALWDWDLQNGKVHFNENWAALLGNAPRESTFTGDEVLGWTHPMDHELLLAALGNAAKGISEELDCEYRVPNAAGQWIWVHSCGKVTRRDAGGRGLRMTGTSTNVTKRRSAEERAEFLATRDPLTELPNRVLLQDRLEHGIVNAARHGTGFAFMFIDLDRFKTINDSLGHHIGDELLKRVAARLTACVRASDTVARLGGDEFAVILENLGGDNEGGAQQVAEKMIAAMGTPILIENHHLNASCSIGISLFPADGRDSAALVKHADVAMYYAKEKGRNNYQFFSAEMNTRAQERLSVENYLRQALKRNELLLHYQPRMTVSNGVLTGVEALLRWQHPRRGLLAPSKFIEVAEDSGLIVPIGEWVLEAACQQLRAWQHSVAPDLRMSVNLSVAQVVDGERLYRAITNAVQRSGIDPGTLDLELTESHLMQNIAERTALLRRLGELGIRFVIDDFGTGYSSLSYLKTLPVEAIKIDSSFVRDIGSDPNDEAIIKAILAMAHSLRLSVVAEGVETQGQLRVLRELGCDEYQGYLASPALPAQEFETKYRAVS